MFRHLEVENASGSTLPFSLFDPGNGYEVHNIDGLGPVPASLVFADFGTIDGTEFQNGSRDGRNVVIDLGLRPTAEIPTAMQLRTYLYRYLKPKAPVTLRLVFDSHPTVMTLGWVETVEPVIFALEPSLRVSIMCGLPDWQALDDVQFDGMTTSTSDTETITYNGSSENGFLFTMTVDRDVSNFTISRSADNGPGQTLGFVGNLDAGDKIEINTMERQKGAWLTRDGVRTSVLYGVSPGASWVTLHEGLNDIRVYTEGEPIPYKIEYLEKYVGF